MERWKSDKMKNIKMRITIYSNNIKRGYYTSFEEVIN
jgi:hypothetical protein